MFAPGIALGHVDRPPRLPLRGLLLRQADDRAVGDHVSQTRSPRPERRHAARRAAPSDAALRSGRRAADPGAAARDRAARASRSPGRTFWLYMLLYGVSRFIIEFYRGDPRGMVGMFSTSQFISHPARAARVVMLVVARRGAGPEAVSARRARGGLTPWQHDRPSAAGRCVVEPEHDGVRLDHFLTSLLPEQSRSQIQRLIKDGHVHGPVRTACGPARRSTPDQTFVVDMPEPVARHPGAGGRCRSRSSTRTRTSSSSTSRRAWSSIPAAGHASGTLVNALLHHVEGSERHRRRAAARASCIGSIAARRA